MKVYSGGVTGLSLYNPVIRGPLEIQEIHGFQYSEPARHVKEGEVVALLHASEDPGYVPDKYVIGEKSAVQAFLMEGLRGRYRNCKATAAALRALSPDLFKLKSNNPGEISSFLYKAGNILEGTNVGLYGWVTIEDPETGRREEGPPARLRSLIPG